MSTRVKTGLRCSQALSIFCPPYLHIQLKLSRCKPGFRSRAGHIAKKLSHVEYASSFCQYHFNLFGWKHFYVTVHVTL